MQKHGVVTPVQYYISILRHSTNKVSLNSKSSFYKSFQKVTLTKSKYSQNKKLNIFIDKEICKKIKRYFNINTHFKKVQKMIEQSTYCFVHSDFSSWCFSFHVIAEIGKVNVDVFTEKFDSNAVPNLHQPYCIKCLMIRDEQQQQETISTLFNAQSFLVAQHKGRFVKKHKKTRRSFAT